MEANPRNNGRLPAAFLTPGSSSFMDFLSHQSPDMLPGKRSLPPLQGAIEAPHGTTIVAVSFPGGVVGGGGGGRRRAVPCLSVSPTDTGSRAPSRARRGRRTP
ncbi:hypothetical protein ACFV0Y_10605, partial [Streptomyces sp. NPDC059569]